MDTNLINLITLFIVIFICVISIILAIVLIMKVINKGDVVIQEIIESSSEIDNIKYYIILKNTKNRGVTVRDFGVLVSPYKVPLLKTHFPLLEQGNLEIMSKDIVKVDLSYLISSKALQYAKGKVSYYYEDAYANSYVFKSKLLKKYCKIKK